jgi:CheY-like chemotaxis protein
MPGMSGFEFTAACRAMPAMRDVPILAYSTSLDGHLIRQGMESGLSECVLKTDRAGLLRALARHLALVEEAA